MAGRGLHGWPAPTHIGHMGITLETWLKIAGTAQSCVPILSLCAYVPQWRKLLKTRSSGSISLISWAIWAGSYSIAVFYSAVLLKVTGHGVPLVVTTSVGLSCVLLTMALIWRFRVRKP